MTLVCLLIAAFLMLGPVGPQGTSQEAGQAVGTDGALVSGGDTVCIAFTGDLMHHCTQTTGARLAGKGEGKLDFSASFQQVRPLLAGADLVVGNLETPIDGRHEGYCFPRFSAPEEYLHAIREAGFHVLSVANNHALDRDSDGLGRTLERIRQQGMKAVGTQDDPLVTVEVNGVKVAVIASTRFVNLRCRSNPCPFIHATPEGRQRLLSLVAEAAASHDITVVFLHWMVEKQTRADKKTRELARQLVEAGAAAVMGHHSHTLADAEWVTVATKGESESAGPVQRTGYVRYSLGNLVHAMKGFPCKMAGVETVCFQRLTDSSCQPDSGSGVCAVKGPPPPFQPRQVTFVPTWTRRNAGSANPKAFQAVSLPEVHAQCLAQNGPYPDLGSSECEEVRRYADFFAKRSDLSAPPLP